MSKWTAVVLAALAMLVIAHDPLFWKRYFQVLAHGAGAVPLSFYEPRELVSGGNQSPAPRVAPASESLDLKALEAAADYAGSHHSRALIVSRHGYIVFERYWQGTHFDTLIDSRSLGRVILALVTGSAIFERRIGWPDEPIGLLLRQWRDDPRGAITVRNLLQLSSGLAPPAADSTPWGEAAAEVYGSDILSHYLRRPLAHPPGTKWLDQSADPDLLAVVIARATGQRYARYVSQALWQRIGAGDAWLWLDRPAGAVHIDRGFLVHQGDWIRVGELLLKNGNYQGDEVLAPRWVPQMLEPARGNAEYGAYLRLGAHVAPGAAGYAARDLFLVEGDGNRLWLIPSLQIAILRTGDPPGAAAGWDDARIPNLIVRGARDFVPGARPGSDLSSIVPNH